PLPTPLAEALRLEGIDKLFSHQTHALDAARRGESVLITTPTASGKSLVFQIPVLEEALAGRSGRALFLFPLKALGQDQRKRFEELAKACGADDAEIAIYDGDTPRPERERIRASPPRVLITNPDMLHFGILSNPGSWQGFLSDVRWVVLDELHTYRGVFGTHFQHVLQRLLRLCRRAGSDPAIIASSATAENAGDFAETLAHRPFRVFTESGAPREGRHFLLWQPSNSPYTSALQLLVRFVERGLKTIVFTKARRITELLHQWLTEQEPELARRVANYRAGFLPEERRDIEAALFRGELDGVISTSALEMGIDVGGLDACILVGFPGSMMATWQRSGRVGREGRESITALVALPDALDQYLLGQPDEFLERGCEPLVLSAGNDSIAARHLLCAAAEMPLSRNHDADYLQRHAPLVGDLLDQHELAASEDGSELYAKSGHPHRDVALRGSGANWQIVSETTGRTIGTNDGVRVLRECHPGAIYLHGGRQFGIVELDWKKRQAIARPLRVDYFTSPLNQKTTEILELLDHRQVGPLRAWLGRVKVTERVTGFERKRILSQERMAQEELELPAVEFETVALWFAAPRAIEETIRDASQDFMGSLHAVEHAAISLFPVLALCDRGDIGGISIPFHPQVQCGAVFVYDGHAGGVGIAEGGFAKLPELLDRVGDLLARCSCETGCPSCIHSPKCGNGNRPLDKAGAAHLVELLRGRKEPSHPVVEPRLDLAAWVTPEGPDADDTATYRTEEFDPEKKPAAPDSSSGAPASAESSPVEPLDARPRDLFDLGPVDGEKRRPPRRARRQRLAPPARRTPLPAIVQKTVLFDVETKRAAKEVGGWHNLHKLGVALAVTCDLEEGVFKTFREEQVADLVAELKSADVVIGFNSMGFDYPVLSGYTGEDYRRTLASFDLLESIEELIGKRLGLAKLAEATLGTSKSADGLISLEWYREGRFDLIEEYCRKDVEILRDLYLHGRREGFVLYEDREGRKLRILVDW
ncbi:MAG: DEAD/DEAH box helicase, partial [Acidobacteriota bacterium]